MVWKRFSDRKGLKYIGRGVAGVVGFCQVLEMAVEIGFRSDNGKPGIHGDFRGER
jgi:hypothetical protein